MTGAMDMAETAALVGDPSRAAMLAALMDGRALTAGELAHIAGVTPATASGHLIKLVNGGLAAGAAQGRHRYYRLGSPAVARILEGLMAVSVLRPERARATPRIDPGLRAARSCYDHLAGALGVALADALVARGAVTLEADAGEITEAGRALLEDFGIALEAPGGRRPLCRPCLDWSERRPHLAGAVGAALLEHLLALGWITRTATPRQIIVTPAGRLGLRSAFGIAL